MIIRDVLASATNTTLVYGGNNYINFDSRASGTTFYQNGVDVTSGVSAVDNGSFTQNLQIQGDDTNLIVDDNNCIYFLVRNFIITTSTLPTR